MLRDTCMPNSKLRIKKNCKSPIVKTEQDKKAGLFGQWVVSMKFVHIFPGVYLTFTTGSKMMKIAGYIDLHTVYVHMDTLENSRQNNCNRR